MHFNRFRPLLVGCLLGLAQPVYSAETTPSSFTYQGRLFEGTNAASGLYDLRFTLYDAATAGNAVGTAASADAVPVSAGLFSVSLDFGRVFDGSARWLQVEERQSGTAAFKLLSPRQPVTSVPYANHALSAEVVPAAGLSGVIPEDRLSSNVARLNGNALFSGTVTATKFAGNAAGLTNVSVPDKSISSAKFAPDVQFTRPDYVTGVSSDLRGDLTLRVLIDGKPSSPPAILAYPYSEAFDVVESKNEEGQLVYGPGKFTNSTVVLRRMAGVNQDWLLYRKQAIEIDSTNILHEIELVFFGGKDELARWSFGRCWAAEHNLRLADDGRPVEQVSWVRYDAESDAGVARTRVSTPPVFAVPSISRTLSGFSSGATEKYSATCGGIDLADSCAVASDLKNDSEVTSTRESRSLRLITRAGRYRNSGFTLIQSPLCRQDLFPWFDSVRLGNLQRKTTEMRLGSKSLVSLGNCWPRDYSLNIGDDGLPYESFEVIYESFSIPQ